MPVEIPVVCTLSLWVPSTVTLTEVPSVLYIPLSVLLIKVREGAEADPTGNLTVPPPVPVLTVKCL